ncbi:DUF11 domain-containing protein [Bacillus sp. FJAT-26390]|uniref:DUF11 domain-containing protein n=1 Tax=Bacillus sp. FJAT-26390 TaxID=1743142 RepID=UPI00080815DA|nr:DUF11 domain-containing protein [Bacillus sp. FJAT-26390]OBZ13121.1 hypothetical protein A7975_09540 [Bacillus sp. FJAT-26390]
MSLISSNNPIVQNQSLVQFASGSAAFVTYSNTVNTALVGTRVEINKSAFESEVSLGSTITYKLIATNTGNVAGYVTLTDKLPEGTSFVANSLLLNGTPLPGSTPESGITIGSLEPQASAQIVFQLIVISLPNSLQLVNQARADSVFQTAEGRRVTSTTYSNALVTPVNPLSVSASLQASTSHTFPSDFVSYSLTIVNEGNLSLRDAVAFLTLPAGVLFVPGSVTVDDVISPEADPRSGIPLGLLQPHSTVMITYRTQTTEETPYQTVSQAAIRYLISGTPSFVLSNEVIVTLVKPEIIVTKQVDQELAVPGDTLHYTIQIRNAAHIAVDARLEDSLPGGVRFVANSLKLNGIPMPSARLEDGITLGTLLGQSLNVVTFAAQIPPQISSIDPITNAARVIYTFRLSDGRVVSNTSLSNSAATEIAAPIIQISGRVAPAVVEYGDAITIHAILTNNGNLAADVSFISDFPYGVDLLPKTYRVDGAKRNPSAYDGNRTWLLGSVPPGSRLLIVYSAVVTDAYLSEKILGYVIASYTYEADGRSMNGEAVSNPLEVDVTGDDE